MAELQAHYTIPVELDTFPASKGAVDLAGKDTPQQNDSANTSGGCLLAKTPTPVYRHATPSGPWPWMDFDEDVPLVLYTEPSSVDDPSRLWNGYPQSSFPNWTESQVDRSKMLKECPVGQSDVYKVDVSKDGKFVKENGHFYKITDGPGEEIAFWNWLEQPREENIRVRALFVENMTKKILQMLGTKYTIEPFFFSSSTNWIPSRYQESLDKVSKSDHITIVLPFIRVIDEVVAGSHPLHPQPIELESSQEDNPVIDTQSPLYLDSCKKYILPDLLSAHMVRTVESSTIISYHPEIRSKTAKELQSLIKRTGDSVYWSKIFERSKDPTCLFLCFMWYAMYEWDEVFEALYAHINHLEQLVLDSKNVRETQHLHILQAHLLYYRTLLEDFRKCVEFVKETENPAMHDSSVTENERADSRKILERETNYLISEIERLESQRAMQVKRLKNVMDLAFATVNIEDSIYMKELTFATVRDSAAMKQISYLTMVFLPANFMSNVFSMNVVEINPEGGETLIHYVESAIALTVFAAWITIALQADSTFFPRGSPVWKRAGWPLFYVGGRCVQMYRRLTYSRNEKHKTA